MLQTRKLSLSFPKSSDCLCFKSPRECYKPFSPPTILL
jgi:hypothetical protein